jgi:serine/threonine-protein kinase TNNI3K
MQPIGKGGYGQVYLGKWLGQDVAVKKYLKKKGFRNKHVGHFIEEVQVINKLLHPSIVLYMGMCIDDNEYDMVTEFLSGAVCSTTCIRRMGNCLNNKFYKS